MCGGQQRVGAFGPKPVGLRERAIEASAKAHARQRGRLVDDRVGLGFEDGLAHGASVEQVERNRFGSERAQTLGVSRRPERADHLVALIDQLRNEPGADRTARPGNEDSHCVLLSISG
jgi:hypothetical protein